MAGKPLGKPVPDQPPGQLRGRDSLRLDREALAIAFSPALEREIAMLLTEGTGVERL